MFNFISRNKDLFYELDIFINSLKGNNDDLIRALHHAQSIFGYLPKEVQIYISEKLNVPYEKVKSIVNFYSYFTTELRGEFKINVCVGRTCSKNNSDKILAEFEKLLGINSGETTNNFKFTLNTTRCVGTCRRAPVVTVNGKDFNGVTLEDVSLILKECNKK